MVGDETTLEAAIKEANEELGLTLTEKDVLPLQEKTRNDREDNRCFATCYYKVIPSDTKFYKQDCEVDGLKWVSFADFVKMVENQNSEECIFKNNEYYQGIIEKLAIIFKKIIEQHVCPGGNE